MTNQSIKNAFQRFWEYVTDKVDKVDQNLANHTHSANQVTGGTFAGPVKAAPASTSDYYTRNIKFSDTAETPTSEGDICFKLK